MEYITIKGTTIELKCERINGKYTYLLRQGTEVTTLGTTIKSPTEITRMSDIGKHIFTHLKNKSYSARNDSERNEKRDKEFRNILDRLQKGLDEDSKQELLEQEIAEKENTEKYIQLYSNFITNRDEYGFTTLQFLGQICQGVGVGVADTVLKVYVALLLTVLGIKATNVIAIGKQSSGKALALNTKIPIPNGYTTMGEIKVGDELYDEKGELCKVTYKSPVFYEHDCYELTFDNDTKVVADADHIWSVSTHYTRKNSKTPILITTENMYKKPINIDDEWNFLIPYHNKRNIFPRAIKDITRVESVPTQCIKVDSPTHLYCIEDYIPTHNTHSLERAIEMIPEEYVVRGVHTKSYFFTKYNHQDVSRKVFYLGDLGGVKDDQNTIDTRDILKELNTDGYVERGLNIEGEAINEYVKGYPAIVYSTVEEDIINDQEKSRSTIINPGNVDPDQLTLFNAVHESPGEDIHLLERIHEDVMSVRGLTWYLMENIEDYELFNPYMFNVSEFLAEMDDFNRKIKEFNKTLFIVSLLNDPFVMEHDLYLDEETYEPKTTKLIIASKQDVLNALVIFDGANNLLPTETALLKGLNKNYRDYNLRLEDDVPVSEYEKLLRKYGEDEELFYISDDGSITEWDKLFIEEDDGVHYYFFTVSSIRRAYASQLWYRNVKDNLSNKLRKLYEHKYLIKLGKSTSNENIYGLIPDLSEKIENNIPVFGGDRLQKGKDEFKRKYPYLYDEFEEWVNRDRMKRCSKVDFEVNESTLYNVPWNIKF